MHKCETGIDNVLMSVFIIPIMFKSMWRSSEMGYTMGCEKSPKDSPCAGMGLHVKESVKGMIFILNSNLISLSF